MGQGFGPWPIVTTKDKVTDKKNTYFPGDCVIDMTGIAKGHCCNNTLQGNKMRVWQLQLVYVKQITASCGAVIKQNWYNTQTMLNGALMIRDFPHFLKLEWEDQ